MKNERVGITDLVRAVVNNARSAESQGLYKEIGQFLYFASRWTLGAVLHPVATFQAVMLIGDQERINRNAEHALRLPELPRGRQRFPH